MYTCIKLYNLHVYAASSLNLEFMCTCIMYYTHNKTGPHCLSVAGVRPRRGTEIGGGGV